MTQTVDILIIGGGCSGLALAYALSQHTQPWSIRILESRDQYTNDRTWCFWSNQDTTWTRLAKKKWHQWSFHVKDATDIRLHHAKDWSYYYLPAIEYYRFVTDHINHHPQIDTVMQHSIEHIQHAPTTAALTDSQFHARAISTCGQTHLAKLIIDTRPPPYTPSLLYQSFYGVEIETPQQDDRTVELMHDIQNNNNGIDFHYTLPLSPKHLLFEYTRFSTEAHPKTTMAGACYAALEEKYPNIKIYHRAECGCLPMGMQSKNHSIFLAGTGAGILRDASGYGFLRIQAWAKMLAQRFNTYPKDITFDKLLSKYLHKQDRSRWLDRLFLETLRYRPDLSTTCFLNLAKQLHGDQFARFMSDQASLLDQLRVIQAMPKWPFIQQLIRRNLYARQPIYKITP